LAAFEVHPRLNIVHASLPQLLHYLLSSSIHTARWKISCTHLVILTIGPVASKKCALRLDDQRPDVKTNRINKLRRARPSSDRTHPTRGSVCKSNLHLPWIHYQIAAGKENNTERNKTIQKEEEKKRESNSM
jgi:hypothetical protein